MTRSVLMLLFWAGLSGGATSPLNSADDGEAALPLERVELLDRQSYEGLIEAEDDAGITMIQIQRRPGQPMHLVVRPIDRREVLEIVGLDAEKKARLRQAIEQFRNHASIEAGRLEAVTLEPRAPREISTGTMPESGSPSTARPTSPTRGG